MNKKLDIVFVNTNSSKKVYQDLSIEYSAIEPPFWSLLLAETCRRKGYSVAIIDAIAENLTHEQTAKRVIDINPRFCCFVTYGSNPNSSTTFMTGVYEVAENIWQGTSNLLSIISVGNHTAALPLEVLSNKYIDYVCINEGVYAILKLLAGFEYKDIPGLGWKDGENLILNNGIGSIVPQERMDIDLPGYAWDLLPYKEKPFDLYRSHNWHAEYKDELRTPFASVYSSLGCKFKCLRGNTLINTVYGKISIKEIAEKYKEIGVYTYDRNKKKVIISKAINIQKTGINKKLVRVIFDDDTYIDCTPDHKFLTFKNGNQNIPVREYEIEAQNLKPKTRVRAIKISTNHYGYKICSGNRYDIQFQYRLVKSYQEERPLLKEEEVHNKDLNKSNNHPDNLVLCCNGKHHFSLHPEISQRMRENNPAKNMTPEWRQKIAKSQTGLKRSLQARKNYSESKKGEKNPNWKGGHTRSKYNKSRLDKTPNHKVKEVIWLNKTDDVYCMEVPGYNWFYANNVLVHNCNFCMINLVSRTNTAEKTVSADSNTMRFWSPEHMIKIFDELVLDYGISTIRILDEMFFLNKKYYEPLLTLLKERGYGKDLRMWTYARVDTVNERFLELFKDGGVKWLALGIEAANQNIRREIYKGKFQDINIRDVVKQIKDHGMYAGCNYIFGHPEEKLEHMQETLDLALELNGEFSNFYTAMALPGSPLYYEAKNNGWLLPNTPEGWSFHSYECQPLPTKYLKPEEVLAFRDKAWHTYFESPSFQNLVQKKFGNEALKHIQKQTKIKLKRKILGD